MADLGKFLKAREEEGLLRTLKPLSRREQGKVWSRDKEYWDLSSNDYLGLAGHPDLTKAAKAAMDRFGAGSCGSRLLSGDLELHHQLEEETARFKNKEAALVFNSGYQANVGIISSFAGDGDIVLCDRLSHASIIDGVLLSGARFFRFRHNDAAHLESFLKTHRSKSKECLIITETIFSMDGDSSPLKALADLKEKYNCRLLVDEAHATGVFGASGSGRVEEEGLSARVDLIMGTFSKALGGFGAYVAASREAIAYLVNMSRSFIYSTALPPSVIASNLAALALIRKEPWRRQKLLSAARHFREGLEKIGCRIKGDSQIVPWIVGENRRALEAARVLQEKGYWVLPVRPPTVPKGEARLRFSLTVYQEEEMLDRLIDDISRIRL